MKQSLLSSDLPRHVAIIMDGNGRWAKNKNLPRSAGHKAGAKNAKTIIKACGQKGIEVLTLFAFGKENWQRPKAEVKFLMDLLVSILTKEVREFHANNVQLHIIGDRTELSKKVFNAIIHAEKLTENNTGLKLVLAINYSGQWDILQAVNKITAQVKSGVMQQDEITAEVFNASLITANLPPPDLFIRTSGEMRLSNFMLWQLAYSELYFTEVLWPDFTEQGLDLALQAYAQRERRFGKISE